MDGITFLFNRQWGQYIFSSVSVDLIPNNPKQFTVVGPEIKLLIRAYWNEKFELKTIRYFRVEKYDFEISKRLMEYFLTLFKWRMRVSDQRKEPIILKM